MQLLILGLLLDGPRSLYDLHNRFQGGVSLFYAASFGSIQRTLHQLVERGWAAVADAPDDPRRRRIHTITPAGRDAWHDGMLEPVSGADAERSMLTRIHLLGHLEAGDRAACLALLRERVAGDADRLAALAAATGAADRDDAARFRRATLDYGIRSHALALAWLDELVAA